jgi:hypothetical protein
MQIGIERRCLRPTSPLDQETSPAIAFGRDSSNGMALQIMKERFAQCMSVNIDNHNALLAY